MELTKAGRETEVARVKKREKIVLALLEQCKDADLSVGESKSALNLALGRIEWITNSAPIAPLCSRLTVEQGSP